MARFKGHKTHLRFKKLNLDRHIFEKGHKIDENNVQTVVVVNKCFINTFESFEIFQNKCILINSDKEPILSSLFYLSNTFTT